MNKMHDRIEEILSKYKKIKLSKKEIREINERISKECDRINREFAIKNSQSIEDAKHIYITF